MENYEEMFNAIDDLKARKLEDEEHANFYQTFLDLWESTFEFLYVN